MLIVDEVVDYMVGWTLLRSDFLSPGTTYTHTCHNSGK